MRIEEPEGERGSLKWKLHIDAALRHLCLCRLPRGVANLWPEVYDLR